jgi:argininosuccinate lyase
LIAEHLSTWAEEWILWSTTEFDFLKLPQTFCTGSSIMPQKINPDVLELTRGKTARVVGNLTRLLVLIKGLPLAYNRDLQEDKPAIFDSFDTVDACLELALPEVDDSVYSVLGVENAVRAFVSYGSTAPAEVARQVERWKHKIGEIRS